MEEKEINKQVEKIQNMPIILRCSRCNSTQIYFLVKKNKWRCRICNNLFEHIEPSEDKEDNDYKDEENIKDANSIRH